MRRVKGRAGDANTLQFGAQLSESAIRQIHAMLIDARAPLIDPTAANIDACRERLNEAAGALQNLLGTLPHGDPKQNVTLAPPLASLRAEIGQVAVLLDSAAAFHMGWMHRAASMVSGYTADGTPATPEPARRVSLEV